jgi:hypothetical protein
MIGKFPGRFRGAAIAQEPIRSSRGRGATGVWDRPNPDDLRQNASPAAVAPGSRAVWRLWNCLTLSNVLTITTEVQGPFEKRYVAAARAGRMLRRSKAQGIVGHSFGLGEIPSGYSGRQSAG